MRLLRLRIDGLTRSRLRRWRDPARGTTATGRALLWPAALVVAVYAINNPGRIEITSPASGIELDRGVVQVAGTVTGRRTESVTVLVNGAPRRVTVENGTFATPVALRRGPNAIQVETGGIARNLLGRANVVNVTAAIPRMDIWSELTWDGPGDIDLHLVLPNGEHCFFDQKTTASGARLDVDNRQRDGPEHIVMETALAGTYRLGVHYYKAVGSPARAVTWRLTVRLNEGELKVFTNTLQRVGEGLTAYEFTMP